MHDSLLEKLMLKIPKIIFFLEGSSPTREDEMAALAIGVPVYFRNAQHVKKIDEKCDGVAGHIPTCYADFPDALTVTAAYRQGLTVQTTLVLETAGGKAPTAPQDVIKGQGKVKSTGSGKTASAAWTRNA